MSSKSRTKGTGNRKTRAAVALAALALAGLAVPSASTTAAAESVCHPRAQVVAQLEGEFSEAPAAMGLAANGGLIELFQTANGNTWTILVTSPKGVSCLVASGEGWMAVPIAPKGPGA